MRRILQNIWNMRQVPYKSDISRQIVMKSLSLSMHPYVMHIIIIIIIMNIFLALTSVSVEPCWGWLQIKRVAYKFLSYAPRGINLPCFSNCDRASNDKEYTAKRMESEIFGHPYYAALRSYLRPHLRFCNQCLLARVPNISVY